MRYRTTNRILGSRCPPERLRIPSTPQSAPRTLQSPIGNPRRRAKPRRPNCASPRPTTSKRRDLRRATRVQEHRLRTRLERPSSLQGPAKPAFSAPWHRYRCRTDSYAQQRTSWDPARARSLTSVSTSVSTTPTISPNRPCLRAIVGSDTRNHNPLVVGSRPSSGTLESPATAGAFADLRRPARRTRAPNVHRTVLAHRSSREIHRLLVGARRLVLSTCL